ncbi:MULTISPECIES: membrane-bound lytic murein transglycosylase MltF [Marinobacter]|jgi:membrane-bound lytic murein transglycosylase F|uniref:membrane-bound lytic murein transglycosylase MltF n=2 Tax=Marinobacteraceae TaxID=2887365 RepID=UPI000C8C8DF9|nr:MULTISPECIES: membrane-bound lytic murein transglycosylase MltF [Marinobacter]MAB51976.1 membrane-bound lytic murein transglycosylase MltF [Marinobacter sp.]MCZ4286882.1 membrane-bound lytic murein transglycosylase MltF [Marinobacter salarius]|tara:strand:+ start:624 stop:2000 length:1377 start_codon:yes stop_codon:yes gene_type:complete
MTHALKGALLPLIAIMAGCSQGESETASISKTAEQLAPPQETGVLEVATRNGATTYYLDRHQNPIGPEFSLVSRFAESKGWTVNWTMHDSTAEVLQALEAGNTHLAAAGLTHLPSRTERFTRGPAHTEITEQLVCHRDMRPMPRKPESMPEVSIAVTADSSYVETLNKLASKHEGITFTEDDSRTTEVLLSEVAEQDIDCTVADSNIVQVMRRHFPHLEVAMNLTQGNNLGWYLPAGSDDLAGTTREWMNSTDGDEAIGYIESRYYAYIGEFDFVDLRALNRRIDERLPNFIDRFAEAETTTGMPADLLAALSYQESHWDPAAVSPTGVRGIMMLTRNTAESLGVMDRLDPVAAIDGGARYLADRHRRLPETIPEPDRTFLALASYNIGRGHLLDARQLARELGKNPDSWDDMKEVLPLKADKRYYPSTRYGYARGYEPVHYVQRIRNYRDVISSAFD